MTSNFYSLKANRSLVYLLLTGCVLLNLNVFSQAPGGVSTNLQVWLKADVGTSTTTNGSAIDSWTDQSGNARTHIQTDNNFQPKFKENGGFNFNPAVTFDGLDAMTVGAFASGREAIHVFTMAKVADNGWRSIYGFGRDATHVQWLSNTANKKPSVWLSGNNFPTTDLGIDYGIASYILPKDGSQKTIHWNGTSGNINGSNSYLYNSNKMAVGSDISNNGLALSENFSGDIQEVIIYKTGTPTTNGGTMATADIQKIQTYLGIKYGVTLSHDYLDASGNVIFPIANYGNNVAGIARANNQGLHQKQAKSVNEGFQPIIGNTAITTLNANNSNDLTDGSYMIWGSNAMPAGFGPSITPPGSVNANFRFARVWNVQETGTVGTVKFAIPTNIGVGNTVYLVRSTDATFDTSDEFIALTNYTVGSNTYLAGDIDFADGDFFTLATYLEAPGDVALGMQVWLKANAGTSTNTDGAAIDSWNDLSGNARTHTQTNNTFKPKFKQNGGFNFNPSVHFDGLDALIADAFASGREAVHVFAMSKVDDGGWRSIYGFGRDATHVQWLSNNASRKPSVWLSGNNFPATDLGIDYGVTSFILPKDGSQKTIHWNGTAGNINGSDTYLYNSNKVAVGTDISNNGLGLSENFSGDIQEVVIYKTGTPTANGGPMAITDIQKIQTYLALKYGVTLSHDYLDGAGNVIFPVATYGKNVAGIARVSSQGLHQKQSTSVSMGIQPIIGLTEITTLNANNPNNLTDGSYMIWGSNNGAASFGTTFSPPVSVNANFHLARIWNVKEVGTVGTVKFAVPQNLGVGNAVYLVRSADATFDASDEYIELTNYTVGSTTYLAGDIDFADNDFFTLATYLEAPGCVAADIKVWLRADKGVTGTSEVTAWADQSGNGYDAIQATPTFSPALGSAASAKFNFNPYIQFDGSGDHLEYKAGRFMALTDPGSVFGVANNTLNAGYENLVDLGIDNPHMGILNNQMMMWMNGSAPVQTIHPNKLVDQQTMMYGWYWNGGTNGGADLSLNGVLFNSPDKDFNFVGSSGTVDGMMTIGGYETVETWTGGIAEVVVYNRNLTALEKQKVNTYMGIKYGVTYPQDYVAAAGTTIYSQAGYMNNIAGIGREQCQGLNQKQSRSVNAGLMPTIGNVAITTDNASNTNTLVEGAFMIWGSNNENELFGSAITVPSGVNANFRMNRIWKVQETNTVGTVKFAMPANTGSSGATYLVRSTDATFNATDEFIVLNTITVGSETYLAGDIDFANGDFFTIAKTLGGPGCVPGIAMWLKADAGITKNANAIDNVTAWADQSGNGRDHVEAIGAIASLSLGKPTFVENSTFNFNPALNFVKTQNDALVGPGFATGLEAVHVFTMARTDGNGWNALYSFGIDRTHPQWRSGVPSMWLSSDYWPFGLANPSASLGSNSGLFYGITSHILNRTTADNQQVWWNGVPASLAGNKNYAYIDAVAGFQNKYFLGNDGYQNTAGNFVGTEQFNGDIMEMAIFKTGTPTQRGGPMAEEDIKKIQTYMGIKYGITLQHDYIAATGTVVYDIANYGNNIFGIAREDCQSLNQKQSQSYTSDILTIGIDGTLAATNPLNAGTFDTDASFLLFGDNNLTGISSVDQGNACTPPAVTSHTNKIWRSKETGSVESVKVKADLAAFGYNANFPVFMQVSSNAAFSSSSNVPMTLVSGFYETDYDFEGTQYIRFVGNTTPPANVCTGDKEFKWNSPFWTWGKKNDTRTMGDQNFTVSISDPDNVIYAPSVYPVGLSWKEHIYIPRYDNKPNSKITTKITMSKTAAGASFEVFDMDHYIGGKDVVNIYGKQGSTTIAPKFSTPANSGLTINSAFKVSASNTPIVWDVANPSRLFVNFDRPIDEIVIEYTKSNQYSFNVFNDIRIRNINVKCKAPTPEVATKDNVYIFKTAKNSTPVEGEPFTYEFMVQNLDCNDKTVDLTDVLPSGLTWDDGSLSTVLTYNSVNAYGSGQTLTIMGIVVPPGNSYILIDAIPSATGTLNNQASFSVDGSNYLSDDPTIAGAENPTPVTIAAGKPVGEVVTTKTVDELAVQQNETLTYSFDIKNNSSLATIVNFDDALQYEATYVGASLSPAAVGGGTVTPYANGKSLIIRGITVPANSSVTFTVDVNVGETPVDTTIMNFATVNTDNSSPYREATVASSTANTQIVLQDSDGDGVSDAQELADGTNPTNGCSYKVASQVYASTSTAWKAQDCDGDGLVNSEEIEVCKTDPLNPDTDDDGLSDNEEKTGIDDPGTPAVPVGISDPLVADCFAESQVLMKN